MKTLIAIAGCHSYRDRADAQRSTWVKDLAGDDLTVKFFSGEPHPPTIPQTDEVWLSCPDSYPERKKKVLAIIRWALDNGYHRLVKIDDDTYLRPERLSSLPEMDYGGFQLPQKFYYGPKFLYERLTVLGAFYVLSARAMEVVLGPDLHPEVLFEDCWVSMQLEGNGIPCVDLKPRLGYAAYDHVRPTAYQMAQRDYPRASNDVIAAWEFRHPWEMSAVHNIFKLSELTTVARARVAYNLDL
jgi:hypothetical protein